MNTIWVGNYVSTIHCQMVWDVAKWLVAMVATHGEPHIHPSGEVKKVSNAATSLCMWVRAMDVSLGLQPEKQQKWGWVADEQTTGELPFFDFFGEGSPLRATNQKRMPLFFPWSLGI